MPDEYGDFRDVPARIREAKERDDQGAELEGLLLWCLAQTEEEAEQASRGVAASYYYELAVLYRKRRDYAAEVRVLERYAVQTKSPGTMPAKLAERLVRARELAGVDPPARPPSAGSVRPLPPPVPVRRTVTVRPQPDPPPPSLAQRRDVQPSPAQLKRRNERAQTPFSTRGKIALGIGAALVVFSLPSLFGGGDDAPPTSSASSSSAPVEVVTFFEADRDSLLGTYAAMVADGRYDEAEAAVDSAYAVTAADPVPTQGDLDTLAAARDAVAEARMLTEARSVPASDLEGNRRAYAALASRFPSNPDYSRRRDEYAGRIESERQAEVRRAERRAARAAFTPRAARGYSSGSRSSGCCKQCSTGQPCGNSCISRSYTCHQPPGCAC